MHGFGGGCSPRPWFTPDVMALQNHGAFQFIYWPGLMNPMVSEEFKDKVWAKGVHISGSGDTELRRDEYGCTMRRDKHGDRYHDQGWEMDHIKPKKEGGSDELRNLRPLNWKINVERGNKEGDIGCW